MEFVKDFLIYEAGAPHRFKLYYTPLCNLCKRRRV